MLPNLLYLLLPNLLLPHPCLVSLFLIFIHHLGHLEPFILHSYLLISRIGDQQPCHLRLFTCVFAKEGRSRGCCCAQITTFIAVIYHRSYLCCPKSHSRPCSRVYYFWPPLLFLILEWSSPFPHHQPLSHTRLPFHSFITLFRPLVRHHLQALVQPSLMTFWS